MTRYLTLQEHAERFMKHLKRGSFRGEIPTKHLVKKAKLYCKLWGLKDSELLHFLYTMNWIEPSAGDTYMLRMDLIRR